MIAAIYNKFVFKIALFLGELAATISKKLGRGSGEQIKGRVVSAISKQAVAIAAKNKTVIIVSATNGKTSMTRLIAEAIKEQFGDVLTNALGANQRAGIIAALSDKENKDAQFCVLEIDERSLPSVFDDLSPAFLILGNLSRDQLDRFGEVNSIATAWKKMLEGTNAQVIANASDPNIFYACKDLKVEQVHYVDIDSSWHDDANTCNICGSLLKWSDSDYACTNCDFKKPENIESIKQFEEIIDTSLRLPGSWNKNNARLAIVALDKIGVKQDSILNAWPKVKEVAGRNAIFKTEDGKTIQLFLAKNPAGYNELLKYLDSKHNSESATIFAFNCNIADGKDPSWLYDVHFENYSIGKTFAYGQRSTDMTLRLRIAGIDAEKKKDLNQIISENPQVNTYFLIASYTQFHALSRSLPKSYELIDNEEI